jgi:hypothetical protein
MFDCSQIDCVLLEAKSEVKTKGPTGSIATIKFCDKALPPGNVCMRKKKEVGESGAATARRVVRRDILSAADAISLALCLCISQREQYNNMP